MIYRCCLCDAADGAIKEGRIKDGEGVPLCALHRAAERWKRRDQQPVALPAYQQHAFGAALVGAGAY